MTSAEILALIASVVALGAVGGLIAHALNRNR